MHLCLFFFLAKSLYVVFGCTLSTSKMILIIIYSFVHGYLSVPLSLGVLLSQCILYVYWLTFISALACFDNKIQFNSTWTFAPWDKWDGKKTKIWHDNEMTWIRITQCEMEVIHTDVMIQRARIKTNRYSSLFSELFLSSYSHCLSCWRTPLCWLNLFVGSNS